MIVLIIALWLPEASSLAPSTEAAWRVYLTAHQVAFAALFMLIASVRPWRWIGAAGALWAMTQAADEWTNGNLWSEQQWEYPLAVALILAAWLTTKNNRS